VAYCRAVAARQILAAFLPIASELFAYRLRIGCLPSRKRTEEKFLEAPAATGLRLPLSQSLCDCT
jgi:hypothetical protein